MKVLQRFSRTMLCMAKSGQRYGPSGKPRPAEAAFQDEFYRCFRDELGPGAGIVSERSCPGQGRIDFYAVTPGWGFELLRDGRRLAEHCKRFERNGIYNQAIQQGILSDWLLLDCRHTVPRNPCKTPLLFLSFIISAIDIYRSASKTMESGLFRGLRACSHTK